MSDDLVPATWDGTPTGDPVTWDGEPMYAPEGYSFKAEFGEIARLLQEAQRPSLLARLVRRV